MQWFSRATAVAAFALVIGALIPSFASAHEAREVADGQFRFVVGFLNEPVSVGDKSGLDLRISDLAQATPGADGETTYAPIEGAEATLQAEVYYGDQTMALTIESRFGQPGAYASYFYPGAAGDYSFRIFGTINGVNIDETFSSGPETFGAVEERLVFPADTASASAPSITSAGAGSTFGLPGGNAGIVAIALAGGVALLGLSRKAGFDLPGRKTQ